MPDRYANYTMAEIGKDIVKAKRLLEAGEVVAIPTETVYGLAADTFNVKAVTNIFRIKNATFFSQSLHTPLSSIINIRITKRLDMHFFF